MTRQLPSLPAAPFLEAFERRGGLRLSRWKHEVGAERFYKAVRIAREKGRIPIASADRLAVALGMHPCEIWGNLWWDLPM